MLEFRIVSGAARQHSLSPGRQEQDRIRTHAERQRTGRGPHLGCDCGELSAGGRERGDSRSAAGLHWGGKNYGEELLVLGSWLLTLGLRQSATAKGQEPKAKTCRIAKRRD